MPRTIEENAQTVTRILAGIAIAAVLAYPLDWAVWRTRVAFGSGVGSVNVSHVTAAEEKGNKEEYYWDGNVAIDCSRSLFPQSTYSPCWYLQHHTESIARP